MIRIFKITIAFVLMGVLLSCSQVLQTVNLDISTEDSSVQEVFNVVEKLFVNTFVNEALVPEALPLIKLNVTSSPVPTA